MAETNGTGQSGAPLQIGEVAASLLSALARGDVVFIAADETRAAETARILKAAAPGAEILHCPASDALPGDSAPPSPANVGQRAAALRRLAALAGERNRSRIALVASGEAAARLYPAPDRFAAVPPLVRLGEPIDIEAFAAELVEIGYVVDDRVDEPGEVAARGQVIDVFPADAGEPYRIEEQEGRVAFIRPYDPVSQLTRGECEHLELGRVTEPEPGEAAVTLLDHLPGAPVAVEPGAEKRRSRFLALAADAAKRRPARAARDICPDARWHAALAARAELPLGESLGEPPPRFVESRSPEAAFARFARTAIEGGERLILLGTPRDLRFLTRRIERKLKVAAHEAADWFSALGAPAGAVVTLPAPIPRGFRYGDTVAVAAADLLGSRAQRDGDEAAAGDAQMFAVAEIRMGDVVVHEDHGIAVVAGLEALPDADSGGGDALVLRFAGDARRLVPVAEADRIWRYGADEDAVTLDKLDGSTWQKRRGEIDAAIAESARGLSALAAERMAREAPVLEPDAAAYERFVSGFPFSETADQARAIAAVRGDLASGKPMDRLVVGDVGYGKTEVALRAAAIAALAGWQVAVAAPTTVLARQHLETFSRRFEGTGVEVASLSRLSTPAEKRRVVAGLKDGSISVVIGTGAVAGKAVEYAKLGLVVVDEEQRFGAADKTKLRELGAGHVLTLSATPIPRTLQTALVGLQQLSIIATPPARRQPIRTLVASFDPERARTALLRERSRGGQSFVVVPRIEDMEPMAEQLRRAAPELELLSAHGKMPAAEIDEAMVRFGNGDGDVLLATNIIEAGLDVPRANTMLVWRADRFGLSQLHQLRGRVGRGSRRGHVFLLTEPGAEIAPRTLKRLSTLQAFDRLGAGFAISARDLDMRGAGDLLGDTQAGHVKLIGVDLYQHLLESALRAARGETVDRWTSVLNLGVEGRLPPEWIPEEELRVALYARLSRIADLPELDTFEEELADRFGELPGEAASLLSVARVRILAREAGIERIDAGPAAIALVPRGKLAVKPAALGLEEKDGRLLLKERIEGPAERLERLAGLLAEIG
ncbi:MAG TPA: TRCF domain-containing protein [Allosphingosinicella sp.]|jgi:transcription-repair coupling factor (superfamily II helicase)